VDWSRVVQAVALDLAPLIAQARLDFELERQAAPVRAHEWALRELSRNLLHNAVKQSPVGGRLAVRLVCDARTAALTIADSGPGRPRSCGSACSSHFRRATPRGAGSAWA
jgi:two-component system sensor histidine kinase TctE